MKSSPVKKKMVEYQCEYDGSLNENRSSFQSKWLFFASLSCALFFVVVSGASANTGIPLVIANDAAAGGTEYSLSLK